MTYMLGLKPPKKKKKKRKRTSRDSIYSNYSRESRIEWPDASTGLLNKDGNLQNNVYNPFYGNGTTASYNQFERVSDEENDGYASEGERKNIYNPFDSDTFKTQKHATFSGYGKRQRGTEKNSSQGFTDDSGSGLGAPIKRHHRKDNSQTHLSHSSDVYSLKEQVMKNQYSSTTHIASSNPFDSASFKERSLLSKIEALEKAQNQGKKKVVWFFKEYWSLSSVVLDVSTATSRAGNKSRGCHRSSTLSSFGCRKRHEKFTTTTNRTA